MARYTKAVCKLCRRERKKLFLKGERCFTPKCAYEHRSYAPGHHGKVEPKVSEYGIRLREKQALRRIYGLSEVQFSNYFAKASKAKGVTGEKLFEMLERRLDNVIYRLGLAASRTQGRLIVRHGHVLIDNQKVDIPSYQVKAGNVISIRDKSQKTIKNRFDDKKERTTPDWLSFDLEKMEGKILNIPTRDQIDTQVEENLIVEYYSR